MLPNLSGQDRSRVAYARHASWGELLANKLWANQVDVEEFRSMLTQAELERVFDRFDQASQSYNFWLGWTTSFVFFPQYIGGAWRVAIVKRGD